MTMIIQVIYCVVMIQCEREFCIDLRRSTMGRLVSAREAANGDMSVAIGPLKPKEKRIFITKIIGGTHELLKES